MKEIKLDHITKIYGHASLDVKITKDKTDVILDIFEGSRFFEGLLRGKKYEEASAITSRICGICSDSHVLTSILAVEDALGIRQTKQTELLRELLVISGWIRSHSLHSYFLALPDYVGAGSIIDMAKTHKEEVARALALQRIGKNMHMAIGGRDVHTITAVVGGFTKVPKNEEIKFMLKELKEGKKLALETVRMFSDMKCGKFERKRNFLSLKNDENYAIVGGDIDFNGHRIEKDMYRKHLTLQSRENSTTKIISFGKEEIMTGPLARINNNHQFLSRGAKKALNESGISLPSNSPLESNVFRAVELLHCIDRGIELLKSFTPKKEEIKKVKINGVCKGCAVTEAPRGVLYHEYTIDKRGFIRNSDIITPTAKNVRCIETDIKNLLPTIIKEQDDKIVLELEKLIRSFDPCISCSTHFLEVNWSGRKNS